jgi:hypothetical protein
VADPDVEHEEQFPRERALASAAKARQMSAFLEDRNVMGAAFGRRIAHDQVTDEPALVVYVANKIPLDILPPSRQLPRRVYVGRESLEVDVVPTGPIYTLASPFRMRERPATAGISIGHPSISAGTLGCVVTDEQDGTRCIISNNHVFADSNDAKLGDAIVQPGARDGGKAPADALATLKRFWPVTPLTNTIDCALAEVTEAGGGVLDTMHDGLIDPPGPAHPAVGLLFAGGCNRAFMNPIDEVLSVLEASFPGGPGSTVPAAIGMHVEKVGRTTRYTTSTILEVDATVTVDGYKFGTGVFHGQIATAWLSSGGDSGSIVCRGGLGGTMDRCNECFSKSTAEGILGFDLTREGEEAKNVRDNYLRHTLIGRYLIEVFYLNEDQMRTRVEEADLGEDEREHARQLFREHASELRRAFLDQDETVKLTGDHLAEAARSLERADKFMRPDEKQAAHEAMDLAQRAVGLNVRQAIPLLNNRDILATVRRLVEEVQFLDAPPADVSPHI